MSKIVPILIVCMLLTACSVELVDLGAEKVRISIRNLPADPTPVPLSPATPTAPALGRDANPTLRDMAAVAVTPDSSVPPAPTAVRAARPTLVPTQPAAPDPVILSFTVEPEIAQPGESLTLHWRSTGGAGVMLEMHTPTVFGFRRALPPNGTLVVPTQESDRHWQRYELTVYNSTGVSVRDAFTVDFRCPHPFFFPTDTQLCPDGPTQTSWAAEQPFEYGRMIWLQDENGQQGIYVFYDDHRYHYFPDTWSEGEPESDPTIVSPPARVQPVRGFGKVWRGQPQVRERLGWALASEEGFYTLYQDVSGFEWNNACHYIQRLDGRVIGTCRRAPGNWFYASP